MNEIRCPNCGKVFQVDEAGYAAIVAQVHTEQFEKEVGDRLRSAQREMEARQQAAMAEEAGKHRQIVAQKEQEIARLQDSAKAFELQKQLDVNTAVKEKDTEIAELRIRLADGTEQVVATDGAWQYRGSDFEATDIYDVTGRR